MWRPGLVVIERSQQQSPQMKVKSTDLKQRMLNSAGCSQTTSATRRITICLPWLVRRAEEASKIEVDLLIEVPTEAEEAVIITATHRPREVEISHPRTGTESKVLFTKIGRNATHPTAGNTHGWTAFLTISTLRSTMRNFARSTNFVAQSIRRA